MGQAILSIEDLAEEIALDAVEAAIDGRVRVALGRYHATILDAYQDRTTRAAIAAGRLVPPNPATALDLGERNAWNGYSRYRRAGGDGLGLDEFTATHVHGVFPLSLISTGVSSKSSS